MNHVSHISLLVRSKDTSLQSQHECNNHLEILICFLLMHVIGSNPVHTCSQQSYHFINNRFTFNKWYFTILTFIIVLYGVAYFNNVKYSKYIIGNKSSWRFVLKTKSQSPST